MRRFEYEAIIRVAKTFFEKIRTKFRTFSEEIRTIRTIFEKKSVQSVQFFFKSVHFFKPIRTFF